MEISSIHPKAIEALLQDAIVRDLATARRAALLKILIDERYLTRQQLITRVEAVLGRGCFGAFAWEDVFYRDIRVVKRALLAAGNRLCYSRSRKKPGYYLDGQPALSTELADIIRHSVAEADPAQLHIFRQMTPAQRFQLGCSVTDAARNAVAYRTQQRVLFPEETNPQMHLS
jgi:hypothetical protein